MYYFISLLICCSSLVLSPINALAAAPKVEEADPAMQLAILHYVNLYRASHHRAPLRLNPVISAEAKGHSLAMAKKQLPFGHQHFNTRIKHLYAAIQNCHAGAENVAMYRTNAKKLVDAWMASPGHRQNILGNYNLTGIGIAHSRPGWAYYTQLFLRQG